jgi:hypothetical protein
VAPVKREAKPVDPDDKLGTVISGIKSLVNGPDAEYEYKTFVTKEIKEIHDIIDKLNS